MSRFVSLPWQRGYSTSFMTVWILGAITFWVGIGGLMANHRLWYFGFISVVGVFMTAGIEYLFGRGHGAKPS